MALVRTTAAALASILILAATPAWAHLNPAGHGSLVAGISHPLSGADHILAMLAVGLWAALLARGAVSGRALWLVPAAFVATMIAGFGVAMLGVALPFVEPVILASVVVIGLLAAVAMSVATPLAMALVGLFAMFHGYAHGGELGAANPVSFLAGFALSTALLHSVGVVTGLGLARLFGGKAGTLVARLAGGGTALAGLWLVAGAAG